MRMSISFRATSEEVLEGPEADRQIEALIHKRDVMIGEMQLDGDLGMIREERPEGANQLSAAEAGRGGDADGARKFGLPCLYQSLELVELVEQRQAAVGSRPPPFRSA